MNNVKCNHVEKSYCNGHAYLSKYCSDELDKKHIRDSNMEKKFKDEQLGRIEQRVQFVEHFAENLSRIEKKLDILTQALMPKNIVTITTRNVNKKAKRRK
jgi:nicotinic acid mononucleotide adenylyltransferase